MHTSVFIAIPFFVSDSLLYCTLDMNKNVLGGNISKINKRVVGGGGGGGRVITDQSIFYLKI